MEAVVISTARSALNSVVNTATTAITDEIGLLLGVQEELFFIKKELETMQAFLRVASTEKVKGEMVITWIKQVQELAFDVEDCLLEASVHLIKKSCLPTMCSVKKRDLLARKIKVLKSRIEDVSKRNLRYDKIDKENGGHTYDESACTRSIVTIEALLVGLEEPKRKLIELIMNEHGDVISVVGMGGLGKTTLVREVYGCQELRNEFKCFVWVTVLHPFNTKEFIESLAEEIPSNSQEVDDEGGTVEEDKIKSMLLNKKSIQEKVSEYLKDKKYLIVLDDLSNLSEWNKIKNVLPSSNGRRIVVTTRSRSLAESASNPSEKIYEIKELSQNDAFFLFCKAVYKTYPNYHFVIDDRDTKDGPLDERKCKMEYATSSNEIMEEDSELQKQCMTINITEDMKTQANLIIESCGRLPLAIVTIGSYLATKPKTSVEWKTMNDHLSSELANNPDLGVVKTVLTSSYDGMPYHLKSCLLYLSVFHNHKEIRQSRIIRRWMADGYVTNDRRKTAAEIGKGYFYDLMGRSLIRPSQMSRIVNGHVKTCNIHDMMYELILAKAMDENMVSLLEDENLITVTDKVRHLVITGGACNGNRVLTRVQLSQVRSVSIFREMGDCLRYHRMKLVRVLDLEGTLDLDNRDLRSVGKLRHLKYLGLRGTKISKLPDSLGKLSELETLDIRNTAVFQLPTGLTKLHKLTYVRAGLDGYNNSISRTVIVEHIAEKFMNMLCWPSPILCWPLKVLATRDLATIPLIPFIVSILWAVCCYGPLFCCSKYYANELNAKYFGLLGVRAPQGIGELRSLNILGMIDIGRSKSLAKEMGKLTNLSKLAVTGFTKENGKILAKAIDDLKHLRSLFLSAVDDLGLRCCLDSISSPPKYLQSLKLYSSLVELPDWINNLENLQKIHFRNTFLTKQIKAIEKLPNLMILYMSYNSYRDVKELCFGDGAFPMLRVMILEGIKELESVSIEKNALKRFEQLKISKCWSIGHNGVSGLDFLVQLKEMEVVVSYSESDETFGSNLREKLSMLPNKPSFRGFKTEDPDE